MRLLVETTYEPLSATTVSTLPAVPTASQRSPWHSPVPYLFGGLAAMLGLIGFALLILACSYWRLSGDGSSNAQGDEERGGEAKTGDGEGCGKSVKVYEEKIVVIMAGDEKPTFLATPVCSRGPSFGDSQGKSNGDDGESFGAKEEKGENLDKTKVVNNDNNDDAGGHAVHGRNSAAADANREGAEHQTQQQN